ncbi:hypothetical protein OR1_04044 [Geobacter sp. OR-1]|uniref:DNA primase family protein n=1 Tax=Geobacter sp. OR-1 TaxID=1266765 RepID=UPI000541EB95|nr:phage/plasmid primase, P4 family [Geobacter sp. OR-1]GAM11728.1 hypothetical protein OR1_04044 [Geobacter sp. OR-1]
MVRTLSSHDLEPKVVPSANGLKPPPNWKPPTKDIIKVPAEGTGINTNVNPIITVVRDPQNSLGKEFTINPDGSISKKSMVSISLGIAVMRQVDTHQELAALMKEVGNDSNAAIINASFDGIDIGEEFLILSSQELENKTGIPQDNREEQKGIHSISYDGKSYKAIGRFKENVRPSCWQYFDRDIDEHTPERFRNISFEEWRDYVAEMLPGMKNLSYCRIASTSARVIHKGKPVGAGNGHLWIKVANPLDVERCRTAMLIYAAQAGMTWMKPRYSRIEPDTVVGHSLTTIIDTSVWSTGRLVFIGKPVVSEGLIVEALQVDIHKDEIDSFNTEVLTLPDEHTIRDITRKAGIQMHVSSGSNGLRIATSDLTLDTEIETKNQGVLKLRELVEHGITGKIRCQTPFRESSSYAAFISTGKNGNLFLFDTGTGVTHWLNEFCSDELEVIRATSLAKSLLLKVQEDCGAPFEKEAIKALAVIRGQNPADFQRIRSELKKVNKDVALGALDTAIKSHDTKSTVTQTHHGFASDIIDKLTFGEYAPIGYAGSLFVADSEEGIWVNYPTEMLMRMIATEHDGKENCERNSDYIGIAQHAISLCSGNCPFVDAPVGLACPSGFYQIKENEIIISPLSPSHFQRVKIDVTPEPMETPMFINFLHDTFASSDPAEEAQQLILVQEIAGAVMFGIMAKYHKAVLFYEPYGRAGKGTLERILRELVPKAFVTAVSPFNWGNEYYLATLVGARLNVVGELPDNKSIPAAAFKTVTGQDLLTGRHPSHRPISFVNEATHLFMSNHLINTVDHSEAFFARWLLVDFPNSRLKSGLPLDPDLANRIIKCELPGIAYWAMLGAQRLMANKSFTISSAHKRLMEKWRRNSNSLEEFIFECCELNSKSKINRAFFYKQYKNWCGENGRHHFAKGTVKELLDHNIGLGISFAKLDGYDIFKGVDIKATESESLEVPY